MNMLIMMTTVIHITARTTQANPSSGTDMRGGPGPNKLVCALVPRPDVPRATPAPRLRPSAVDLDPNHVGAASAPIAGDPEPKCHGA